MAPIAVTAVAANGIVKLSTKEIDPAVKTLVEASIAARKKSYCPYSHFSVGAALLCKDGTIFQGCNVENVSFGLTICAERTAVVKAISEGKREDYVAVAVTAEMKDIFTTPCGACRQFLAEFNPRMKVYMYNPATDKVAHTTLEHLLPGAFTPEVVTFDLNIPT